LDAGHDGLADGYGENLYWGASSENVKGTCADAVNDWY